MPVLSPLDALVTMPLPEVPDRNNWRTINLVRTTLRWSADRGDLEEERQTATLVACRRFEVWLDRYRWVVERGH